MKDVGRTRVSKLSMPWNKIAIFDINHGALNLAKKFRDLGYHTLAFDTYGKVSKEKKNEWIKQNQIGISEKPEEILAFDVVFAPIHLSPENSCYKFAKENKIPVMTHHDAVAFILASDKRLSGKKIIEVTGDTGKTSTVLLYASMASARETIAVNTTCGTEIWKNGSSNTIRKNTSISPAHIPEIIDEIFQKGYEPSVFVFEISLGLTGYADINVITSLEAEYDVAGGTMSSTTAKLNFTKKEEKTGKIIFGYTDKQKIEKAFGDNIDRNEMIVFDEKGASIENKDTPDVYIEYSISKEGKKSVAVESSRTGAYFIAKLQDSYIADTYTKSFAASISMALETGVLPEDIERAIEKFDGIAGRMKEINRNGRIVLDNSGSGLNIDTCLYGLECIQKKYMENEEFKNKDMQMTLIVGEEAENVCDGLSPESVLSFLEKSECLTKKIWNIILVGERMEAIFGSIKSYRPAMIEYRTAEKKTEEEKTKTDKTTHPEIIELFKPDESEKNMKGYVFRAESLNEAMQIADIITKDGDMILSFVKCFR